MINEFHAALINRAVDPSAIGNDYVDPSWFPVEMSAAAKAVHGVLFVEPENASACNWRSYELRRLIPKTDLADFMLLFDQRSGYSPSEQLGDMSRRFVPNVVGLSASDIKLTGSLVTPAYRPMQWRLVSDGSAWLLREASGKQITGDFTFTGEVYRYPTALHPLPQWAFIDESANYATAASTGAIVRFPAQNIDVTIDWVARPNVNLATVASQLATTGRASVIDLAEEKPSVFDAAARWRLRDIVVGAKEPVAAVCAAAILLAGRNLRERTAN